MSQQERRKGERRKGPVRSGQRRKQGTEVDVDRRSGRDRRRRERRSGRDRRKPA